MAFAGDADGEGDGDGLAAKALEATKIKAAENKWREKGNRDESVIIRLRSGSCAAVQLECGETALVSGAPARLISAEENEKR